METKYILRQYKCTNSRHWIVLISFSIVLMLSSCKKDYYEFSDAEEYMLPYKEGDSILYSSSDRSESNYLYMTSYERYVSDEGSYFPPTYSFDIKDIEFDDVLHENYLNWRQDRSDNIFTVSVSTKFNNTRVRFYYYHDSTRKQDFYSELTISEKQYYNVYVLENYFDNTGEKIYFNSDDGFLMLEYTDDIIYFGKTLENK